MQRFFEKRLHNSIFWLTFATETKNKQVMKQVYIEEIFQDGKLVTVGSVFSSKIKALAHIAKINKEQKNTVLHNEPSVGFGITYTANNVTVTINMTESYLQ